MRPTAGFNETKSAEEHPCKVTATNREHLMNGDKYYMRATQVVTVDCGEAAPDFLMNVGFSERGNIMHISPKNEW